MKIEQLKRIFEFLEDKEGHNTPFKWKLVNNEPLTKKDLVQKGNLTLINLNIVSFPKELDGLYIKGYLRLFDCTSLTSLPNDLKVDGGLNLTNCKSLTSLPNNLEVGGDLDLEACTSLTSLPNNLEVGGYLNLFNCTSLTSLPNDLNVGGYLDLYNCKNLTSLPNDLNVGGYLYIRNTIFAKMTDEKIRAMFPNGYINGEIIR